MLSRVSKKLISALVFCVAISFSLLGAHAFALPKTHPLPKVRGFRWGNPDAETIRAVLELEGKAEPRVAFRKDASMQVTVAPFSKAQAQRFKSSAFPIPLKISTEGTFLFECSSYNVKHFLLQKPYRCVIDFTEKKIRKTAPVSLKDKKIVKAGTAAGAGKKITSVSQGKTSQQKQTGLAQSKKHPVGARRPAPSKKKKLIVIDAGHGGKDPGAVAFGYQEKNIALQISQKVAEKLRNYGFSVRMTRNGDSYPTLKERTAMANELKADVFISIHLNALPRGRHSSGIEIYLMALPTDNDAMMLAKIENAEIADSGEKKDSSKDERTDMLLSILGNMQQNAKIDESMGLAEKIFQAGLAGKLPMKRVAQAPFWVLRGAVMPSVLIETGYITERSETRQLARFSYQNRLAEMIAQGTKKFVENRK